MPDEKEPRLLPTNLPTRKAALATYRRRMWIEFGHRIGKHDFYLDILPPGYILKTRRDDQGQLHPEVEYDQAALSLPAWLRCLVFNCLLRKQKFASGMNPMHRGELSRAQSETTKVPTP